MASLYKRKTRKQALALKIIEGAVRNAAYHHLDNPLPSYFARSVAKRAVGTLTAVWPDVLAPDGASQNSGAREAGTPDRHNKP